MPSLRDSRKCVQGQALGCANVAIVGQIRPHLIWLVLFRLFRLEVAFLGGELQLLSRHRWESAVGSIVRKRVLASKHFWPDEFP